MRAHAEIPFQSAEEADRFTGAFSGELPPVVEDIESRLPDSDGFVTQLTNAYAPLKALAEASLDIEDLGRRLIEARDVDRAEKWVMERQTRARMPMSVKTALAVLAFEEHVEEALGHATAQANLIWEAVYRLREAIDHHEPAAV